MTDKLIDFNIKLKEIDKPPVTETDIDDDQVIKLFQVTGIHGTNTCQIREVGYCDKESKKNVMIYTNVMNGNIIQIFSHIYALEELQEIKSLDLISLQIISDQFLVGDYIFKFDSSKSLNYVDHITFRGKCEKYIDGFFYIYDNIDLKIINKYETCVNSDNIIPELINAISADE